ncbi:hypothetical protein [Deefgea sp. CFH1-16]|uniref:hypothetical protein n=1 Tax=Deefgea sp. CFH1-16 TaxID=2675457 RepID=UPI0015F542F8|nr:hypothetical protein [Deefgea sp. CFH1-16]MBM5574511.1 hypothetical protein [Deefgea sp. CFH1-16]
MRDVLLLVHFLGLVIGAGSGFALFFIGHLAQRWPAEARRETMVRLFALRYASYVGLLLLVLSGGALLRPYSTQLAQMPWLWVKALAVTVIVICAVLGVWRMRQVPQQPAALLRLPILGKVSLAASVLAILAAVMAFS